MEAKKQALKRFNNVMDEFREGEKQIRDLSQLMSEQEFMAELASVEKIYD